MGSFATLGALAGGAQGWVEGSDKQEKIKQNKLDQEREERLNMLKHNRTLERDAKQQEYAVANEELASKNAGVLQAGKDQAAMDRTVSGDTAHMDRTKAEIAGRKEVAKIGADAKVDAAKRNTKKSDWQYTSEPVSSIDPETGAVTQTVEHTMRSKNSQIAYVQEGNYFRRKGDESQVRSFKDAATKERAEAKLLANPTFENGLAFYERVGYLPINWFQVSGGEATE